jgi:hypothetical protein
VTAPAPGEAITDAVRAQGFARLRPAETQALLGLPAGALAGFAASWQRLEPDGFMADGGRYRRRRLANFLACPERPATCAACTGRISRPAPITASMAAWTAGSPRWRMPSSPTRPRRRCSAWGAAWRMSCGPGAAWFVEMHQFRIEAAAGHPGHPTPEGVHQDGVDCVLIAMLAAHQPARRRNAGDGPAQRELARFTLDGLLDLVVLDDRRVLHGVTPVEPADAAQPSSRDVLVLTWKRLCAA